MPEREEPALSENDRGYSVSAFHFTDSLKRGAHVRPLLAVKRIRGRERPRVTKALRHAARCVSSQSLISLRFFCARTMEVMMVAMDSNLEMASFMISTESSISTEPLRTLPLASSMMVVR